MSSGLRLVAAPGLLLAAALLVYSLPRRAERVALALSAAAVVGVGVLLISTIRVVEGGGRVERSLGTMVGGVPLAVRGDTAGVVLALVATAACAIVLLGPAARPLQRCGLLLCLAGSCTVCLGATVVLLYAGIGIGSVGGLLLVTASTSDPALLRRAKLAFAVEAVAGLALLDSAVRLQVGVGTSDLTAVPESYLGGDIATPWAIAGVALLAGAGALPAGAGARASSGWLAVAAVPSGLAVLLRLGGAEGAAGSPHATSAVLVVAAVGLSLGGGLLALRERHRPAAAGRALLLAAAGQVLGGVAAGSPAAATAGFAVGIGLVLAAAAAPAWACSEPSDGDEDSLVGGLGLLLVGGLPLGAVGVATLIGVGAEAAAGPPRSVLGLATGLGALAAGLGGATAALDHTRSRPRARVDPTTASTPRDWRALVDGIRERLDTRVAILASLAFAALPGLLFGSLAERLAPSSGQVSAPDIASVRAPGGGWIGAYAIVAALLLAAMAWAAGTLAGMGWRAQRTAPVAAELRPQAARRWPGEQRLRSLAAGLGRLDAWLVEQPDLPVVLLAAAASVAWFTLRK